MGYNSDSVNRKWSLDLQIAIEYLNISRNLCYKINMRQIKGTYESSNIQKKNLVTEAYWKVFFLSIWSGECCF